MRNKRRWWLLVLAGAFVLAAVLLAGRAKIWAWEVVVLSLHAQFPSAPTLTVDELDAALGGPRKPLLVDARGEDEFAVSRLRGAVGAPDAAAASALLTAVDRDDPVVVYCSLGYRSAKLVEALRRAGYTDTRSLEGGIFAWANSGRPVYRGDRPVEAVHPYRLPWGLLLDPRLRSAAPPSADG
jgi:rhodanese-related sulfurtransferase